MPEVRVEKLVIPTYLVGPDDRNPDLVLEGHSRIYPYTLRDDLTGIREDREYTSLVLENEYLRASFLPELGGHLYSLFDKTSSQETFYANRVFKPGLIKLRGAWIPAGVEFNFPVGHSVTSCTPVDWAVREHPDGSASVAVGDIERMSRMKWTIEATLRPSTAALEIRTFLYNRTRFPNRYYYWANAAVAADEGLQYITDAPYAWSWGRYLSFPVHKGKDISWYKHHEHSVDLFTPGSESDFFGSYSHTRDAGVVHIANHHELPGKKFFTWGVSSAGLAWAKILSDDDGPYCEIQCGRFDTQADFGIIEAHEAVEWKEWWYPVKRMRGFLAASREAAVNLKTLERREDGRLVFVAANSTRPMEGATLRVEADGGTLWERRLDIAPDAPFSEEIELPRKGELSVKLLSPAGRLLLSHSESPPKADKRLLRDPLKHLEKRKTADDSYVSGRYQVRRNLDEQAEKSFREALERDPTHIGALRELGVLKLKQGLWKEAKELLSKAAEKDEFNFAVQYYLGLALAGVGEHDLAHRTLSFSSRSRHYAPCAFHELGALEARRGNPEAAARFFEMSVERSPSATRTRGALACTLRRCGRLEEAREHAASGLDHDPTEFFCERELALALRALGDEEGAGACEKSLERKLSRSVQDYMELGADYLELGQYEEAAAFFRRAFAMPPQHCEGTAVAGYLLGYSLDCSGKRDEAAAAYKKAQEADGEYVFPHRLEEITALRSAIEMNPSDARARYYLGNILWSRRRTREAEKEWRKSARLEGDCSVVFRNLAQAVLKQGKTKGAAAKLYEKAVARSPHDHGLYVDLDGLYSELGDSKRRARLWTRAAPDILEHSEARERYAVFLIDAERLEEVIEFVETRHFNPWEGGRTMKRVHLDAHYFLAEGHWKAKDYEKVIEECERATRYPETIKMGVGGARAHTRELFLMAKALEKLGRKREARARLKEAASASSYRWKTEYDYYLAMALKELGKKAKARKAFRELLGASKGGQVWPWNDPAERSYLAGLARLGLGQKKEARELFKEALSANASHRHTRRRLEGKTVF